MYCYDISVTFTTCWQRQLINKHTMFGLGLSERIESPNFVGIVGFIKTLEHVGFQ